MFLLLFFYFFKAETNAMNLCSSATKMHTRAVGIQFYVCAVIQLSFHWKETKKKKIVISTHDITRIIISSITSYRLNLLMKIPLNCLNKERKIKNFFFCSTKQCWFIEFISLAANCYNIICTSRNNYSFNVFQTLSI